MKREDIKVLVKQLLTQQDAPTELLLKLSIDYIEETTRKKVDEWQARMIVKVFGWNVIAEALIVYYAPRVGIVMNRLYDKTGQIVLRSWFEETDVYYC